MNTLTRTLLAARFLSVSMAGAVLGLAGGSPAMAQTEQSDVEALLSNIEFSGFVSSSFFYNFNSPDSDITAGRSFDDQHADFMINKFKLEFEKPVEASGEKWDAGFRADLVFGQDAALIQSAGLNLGDNGDLEQGFITVNVPVGNGLQVSAGKWVTLMGLEVIEETVNPNWSEGNQFLFVENFTGTGVQLSYQWSDKIDTQFRVFNGWDVVDDNNNALSFMGRIGYTPSDQTTIGLVGYGGPERDDDTSAWRSGVNLVISHQITPQLTVWLQGDYGREEANEALPIPTESAEWSAGGLWVAYDFSEKIGIAVRADYFDDKDGSRTSGAFPDNTGHELTTLTVTLNFAPIETLQIRPEVRWDHSSEGLFENKNGLFTKKSQITVGVGVAYLF